MSWIPGAWPAPPETLHCTQSSSSRMQFSSGPVQFLNQTQSDSISGLVSKSEDGHQDRSKPKPSPVSEQERSDPRPGLVSKADPSDTSSFRTQSAERNARSLEAQKGTFLGWDPGPRWTHPPPTEAARKLQPKGLGRYGPGCPLLWAFAVSFRSPYWYQTR